MKLKVGDTVMCSFGTDKWYFAVIVGRDSSGIPLCFSDGASIDGEGHDGGGRSDYGHWYLYANEEGEEWRRTDSGKVPTQNPANNMVRKR